MAGAQRAGCPQLLASAVVHMGRSRASAPGTCSKKGCRCAPASALAALASAPSTHHSSSASAHAALASAPSTHHSSSASAHAALASAPSTHHSLSASAHAALASAPSTHHSLSASAHAAPVGSPLTPARTPQQEGGALRKWTRPLRARSSAVDPVLALGGLTVYCVAACAQVGPQLAASPSLCHSLLTLLQQHRYTSGAEEELVLNAVCTLTNVSFYQSPDSKVRGQGEACDLFVCACVRVCTCAHACVRACVRVCTHVCVCVCVHMRVCACMGVCMNARIFLWATSTSPLGALQRRGHVGAPVAQAHSLAMCAQGSAQICARICMTRRPIPDTWTPPFLSNRPAHTHTHTHLRACGLPRCTQVLALDPATLLVHITPLLLSDNEEAIVEAARVFGNFSRAPPAREYMAAARVLEALVLLLDHSSSEVLYRCARVGAWVCSAGVRVCGCACGDERKWGLCCRHCKCQG